MSSKVFQNLNNHVLSVTQFVNEIIQTRESTSDQALTTDELNVFVI